MQDQLEFENCSASNLTRKKGNSLDTIPLDCLQAGETGQVAWIEGRADFVTRLAEMGLRQGATIRMIQPGSPCILALNGHRLSIRVESDTEIFVELIRSGAVSI